jgi:hypothetical protein
LKLVHGSRLLASLLARLLLRHLTHCDPIPPHEDATAKRIQTPRPDEEKTKKWRAEKNENKKASGPFNQNKY